MIDTVINTFISLLLNFYFCKYCFNSQAFIYANKTQAVILANVNRILYRRKLKLKKMGSRVERMNSHRSAQSGELDIPHH